MDKVIPEDIIKNAFTDDHSLRKPFPTSDTQKEKWTKEKLENTFATIKSWMDQLRLKLNGDKTKYITFGSRTQLWKVSSLPLIAGNDVTKMSFDVKYLGVTQHHENKESHVKLHMH